MTRDEKRLLLAILRLVGSCFMGVLGVGLWLLLALGRTLVKLLSGSGRQDTRRLSSSKLPAPRSSSKLPPTEEVGMPYDNEIILTEVTALDSLTVWAHEAGIIMRDGKITDVFQEDRRSIPRGLFGEDEVRTFKAYTSPFDLVYWLNDPEDSLKPNKGIALDSPVLTSDRLPVTGSIGITFSVIPDMADYLLRLLGPRNTITRDDVANAIGSELQTKVLGLDLHQHTAADLRGSRDLLSSIHDSLEGELHLTFYEYGLQMDNFYVNLGLTHEEGERVRQQRHRRGQRITQRENLRAGPSDPSLSKMPIVTVRRPTNDRKGQVPSRGMQHRDFFQPLVDELRRIGFTDRTEAHATNYQRFGSRFTGIHYAASFDKRSLGVHIYRHRQQRVQRGSVPSSARGL